MKKLLVTALAVVAMAGAEAQSVYDAAGIAQRDLNGTARFVGMGGAMSALGGDISTIGTNPAGIGLYRSNDVMLSFGYSSTGTESKYGGSTFEADKNRWDFDNVGAVISTKVGNRTAVRYVNFGFNYHKTKSFYRNMTMEGMMGTLDMGGGTSVPVSQARYMAQQATNNQSVAGSSNNIFQSSSNPYMDGNIGWLGALGYDGWLMDEGASPYFTPYVPDEAYGYFLSRERGGIDQYDFNVSFNVEDRFYFGVTVGAYSVDYNKYSVYDESFSDDEGYSLETFKRIHGSGFNVKFGAIVRPFEFSSLRIGLAVHTPTYYNLTYTTGALLTSDMLLTNQSTGEVEPTRTTVDTYALLDGRDMDTDFELRTPWLVNASVGYTVGTNVALGAEYEYENYRSMEFKYPGGDPMAYENNELDLCLKAVHTFRVGAEWKVVPAFSVRAGYNYSSSLYDGSAVNYLPDNSVATDTDFTNYKALNVFTLGIGYRASAFYVDLAYKYRTQKADFYPFFNELSSDAANDYMVDPGHYGNSQMVTPPATRVTNTRSQVILTLGYRF